MELASLANLAGISQISNIVDNATNVDKLLKNEEAVKYMLHECTGDFMLKAIGSPTFMNAYKNSPYKTMIDENEHWAKFLTIVK